MDYEFVSEIDQIISDEEAMEKIKANLNHKSLRAKANKKSKSPE